MNRSRGRETGSALAMVLILAATILLTVVTIAALLDVLFQRAARRGGESQALALAEAGAEKAMAELKRSPSYHGETLRLSTGTATVEVKHETAGRVRILSRGECKAYHRVVRIEGWRDPHEERFLLLEWNEGR